MLQLYLPNKMDPSMHIREFGDMYSHVMQTSCPHHASSLPNDRAPSNVLRTTTEPGWDEHVKPGYFIPYSVSLLALTIDHIQQKVCGIKDTYGWDNNPRADSHEHDAVSGAIHAPPGIQKLDEQTASQLEAPKCKYDCNHNLWNFTISRRGAAETLGGTQQMK